MKQKLASRKFWVAVATVISGILMMFGFAEASIEVIAGAVVTLGGALGYIITEGLADVKKLATVVESGATIYEEVHKELTDEEVDRNIL